MSGNVADVTVRALQQGRLTTNRSSVLPSPNTRAPAFQGSARMGSAMRGDGGAEELMRTLGLLNKAAGSFQEYAERAHQSREDGNAGQGAIDQATGNVDPVLTEQSAAYKRAVELGRERTTFPSEIATFGSGALTELVEKQTSADLTERRAEVEHHIDQFLRSYALDPETGNIRDSLTTPEAKRWLAGAMTEGRQSLSAAAHERIDRRLKDEGLANAGDLAAVQLDIGTLDIPTLRAVLPPTVTDAELRGTLLTTLQGKAVQLKEAGRGADAYRILGQLLGDTTPVDAPVGMVGDETMPSVSQPTVSRRRSRDDVIGFVLNQLEGGPVVVNNDDGGGTTKFGITQHHNPGVDVESLTFAQASDIARDRYWQPAYDDAHPATAAIAFDAGFINSKTFGRELATKFRNDPAGALGAYRERLREIAKKPDKSRFLRGWMNRVDRLGTYLAVGSVEAADMGGGDPAFASASDPLDPVEEARRNPGASLASQLTGGLALQPDERTRLIEFREQLSREIKQEWRTERRKSQDDEHGVFLMRLSGLGAPATRSDITAAVRNGTIRNEDAYSLLRVIQADTERATQEGERMSAAADRARDKDEERLADSMVSSLMAPVYSGTRSPGEALALFNRMAPTVNPRVRRAVLGVINSEANAIEAMRRENPVFVAATDRLDDGEQALLRAVRAPYRDPVTGRVMTVEQQRAIISLEHAKAKRALARAAVNRGDLGNLPGQLETSIASKIRPYFAKQAR